LDDANAGSTTFGIGCDGAPISNSIGALALTVANFPAGYFYAGFNLLVNPSPALITVPVVSDARGGSQFVQPLLAGWSGWNLYSQYIWLDPTPAGGVISASDALHLSIR
jgi:hypothetical protein